MSRMNITHDARCLIVIARSVVERKIEECAEQIARRRNAASIEPDDIQAAMVEVLHEHWEELPDIIESDVKSYQVRNRIAA